MKSILMILTIIAVQYYAFSQDYEPRQIPFSFNGIDTNYYFTTDSILFTQNNFMLGWHWGQGITMSEAIVFPNLSADKFCI